MALYCVHSRSTSPAMHERRVERSCMLPVYVTSCPMMVAMRIAPSTAPCLGSSSATGPLSRLNDSPLADDDPIGIITARAPHNTLTRMCIAMRARSSSPSKGLLMKSLAPALKHCMMLSCVTCAESMTMGSSVRSYFFRRRSHRSTPDMRGIMTSSSTRSGSCSPLSPRSWMRSRHSYPLMHVVSLYSSPERIDSSTIWLIGLSSTVTTSYFRFSTRTFIPTGMLLSIMALAPGLPPGDCLLACSIWICPHSDACFSKTRGISAGSETPSSVTKPASSLRVLAAESQERNDGSSPSPPPIVGRHCVLALAPRDSRSMLACFWMCRRPGGCVETSPETERTVSPKATTPLLLSAV
mmetsp:Transcript_21998/g.54212  ORF Transcript_21998/g.54212 Transcript_21998/m.54212 type:complete len:354 (-) Transcript_21998:4155-5216(-)